MRLPEFLINLFTRYAPVEKETLANLRIELTNLYMNHLNKASEKEQTAKAVEPEILALEKELEGMDEHTPEYEKKLFELEELESKIEDKSILEKAVEWLDKPLVRAILLISFVFVSRFIAKKLTEVKEDKEKDKEQEFEEQQNFNPYPPAHWQPYGYGQPPMYGYQNPVNQPNRKF